MPEIKQNFTKGKMNKDLDERLVPNGEYREAMNIQLATSEGSDIGTAQSLLGNSAISNHLPDTSVCVGAIADEKDNSLYWFVAGIKDTDFTNPNSVFDLPDVFISRDYILRYKDSVVEYVFVDERSKVLQVVDGLANMNPNASFIPLSLQASQTCVIGDEVSYILGDDTVTYPGGIITAVETTTAPFGITLDTFIVNSPLANGMVNQPQLVLVFEDPVLNFHPEKLLTGINVIDDMLIWCDGIDDDSLETRGSEPKKINIERSIEGTNPNGLEHTLFINEDRSITAPGTPGYVPQNATPIREEHITVIKKSPLSSPDLELTSNRRVGNITGEFTFSFEDTNHTGYLSPPGTSITITIRHPNDTLDYLVDDILLIENTPEDLDDIIYPLRDELIKLKVISVGVAVPVGGHYESVVEATIESISNQVYVPINEYVVDLQPSKDSIFKFKFPKFATRYKYVDNEYSTISPFTQTAFIPETWDYQSKKGLNLGMQNNLEKITLNNIIPTNIPDGVVQVDILYKESNSANVYLLDDVKPGDGTSNWANNSYVVHSELVNAMLPGNQLLRPWDNVPRKALAQEVTGNRLVYGNYLQNYSDSQFTKSNFTVSLKPHNIKQDGDVVLDADPLKKVTPLRSIKSLREYQFGVVYEDDYGRQSPVFTGDSGWLNVEKEESGNTNILEININNTAPVWANKFRFYVKDASDEYYNMAMDRWFDAEDGNVWLSFPSLDRNKITEESTLVLKKNIDLNDPITTVSEYKVIAIKNEVPAFVKSAKVSYGIQTHTDAIKIFTTNPPIKDGTFVRFNTNNIVSGILGRALVDWSGDERLNKKMYVRFHKSTAPLDKSNYYEIASMTDDQTTPGEIRIAGTFGADVEFVTDASLNVAESVGMELTRETDVDKSAYDGRFFVKILQDQNLRSSVLTYQYSGGTAITGAINARFLHYLGQLHSGSSLTETIVAANGTAYNASGWFPGLGEQNHTLNGDFPHPFPFMPDADNAHSGGLPPSNLTAPGTNYFNECYDRGGEFWGNTIGNNIDHFWFIDMEPTNHYPATPPSGYSTSTPNAIQAYKNTPGMGAQIGTNRLDISYVGKDYEGGAVAGAYQGNNVGGNFVDANNMNIHNQLVSGGKFRFNGDPGRIIYTILSCRIVAPITNTWNDSPTGINWSGWNSTDAGLYRIRYELELDQLIGTTIQGEGIITPNNHQIYGTYDGTLDESYSGGEPVYQRVGGYGAFYDQNDANPAIGQTPVTWENEDGTNRIGFVPVQSPSFRDISWGNKVRLGANPNHLKYAAGETFKNEIFLAQTNTGTSFSVDKMDTSANPAIWETIPEKILDLELYYEASQSYPLKLGGVNSGNSILFAPIGSVITDVGGFIPSGTIVYGWSDNTVSTYDPNGVGITLANLSVGEVITFTKPDGSYSTAIYDSGTAGSAGIDYLTLETDVSNMAYGLSWYNCFAFGNGVESNRISDTFNSAIIDKGVRVSTILQDTYEEENRKYGLIYSGIYNSTSGINNLNQFIQAEKITKDLNPTYGSIQKLFQRRISLIAFCEDRVIQILSHKDALYNADGNPQLISTNNVLGEAQPFMGEYGISKNPESFATESYRAYFTDKQRGAVLRLSKDGITAISEAGMSNWFKDNLRNYDILLGSYDDRKKEYNLTLKDY